MAKIFSLNESKNSGLYSGVLKIYGEGLK